MTPTAGRSSAQQYLEQRVRSQQWYGARASTPDWRDHLWVGSKRAVRTTRPKPIDWRVLGQAPAIRNQGQLGSCTGFGTTRLLEWRLRLQGLTDYVPSPLAVYFWERQLEGTVSYDAGAEIRDGLKVLANIGGPHETLWPYDIGRFRQEPGPQVYTDAAKRKAIQYARVKVHTTDVKRALLDGPIVIGFAVYDSFESDQVARDGVVPIPKASEQLVGYHCVVQEGWERVGRYDYGIYANSWDTDWGNAGYFIARMSWMCNTHNADDFWALTTVAAPSGAIRKPTLKQVLAFGDSKSKAA
jgi:C1A family cysteine protease